VDNQYANKINVDHNEDKKVMDAALLAGHILLENGAEISRVEETMERICLHFGVMTESAFVLSNGIFMTGGGERENVFAKVRHIPVSGTRLDKVAEVNQLSREIEQGYYDIEQVMDELRKINQMPENARWLQILASGAGSAAFCCLFGGDFQDTLASFFVGIVLYIYVLYVGNPYLSKIVRNIAGGLVVTLMCRLMFTIGLGHHMNHMVIGSIIPLIPGVAFTNSIRDIVNGDYISGSVRMLDALLVFFCISLGVGMGISFLAYFLGGGVI